MAIATLFFLEQFCQVSVFTLQGRPQVASHYAWPIPKHPTGNQTWRYLERLDWIILTFSF
jgi:hypothetical protein